MAQIAAADFATEFPELRKTGKDEEIRKYLGKAAETEKENPEYYAQASNYWWLAAQQPVVGTKPAEKGDLSIRDKETGEEVGSLSTDASGNPELSAKALAVLEEGVKRFPARVDIVLGLAHVQGEMGKFPECLKTLEVLIDTAKAKPGDLRWAKNEPLPEPPGQFIPESIHGYGGIMFNAEQDELCEKLCDRIIAAYPEHPYAYNLKAGLADAHDKPDEALRMLELALSKAPDDILILMNLADTYTGRGDKPKAEKALRRVLELKPDEETTEQAKEMLKALESPEEKK